MAEVARLRAKASDHQMYSRAPGMSTYAPIPVVVYERAGCCLCEKMLAVVEQLSAEFRLDVQQVDISQDAGLEERFGHEIPVLFVAGRKAFKYRVTAAELRRRFERARVSQRDTPAP
jgi:hypothetical protein